MKKCLCYLFGHTSKIEGMNLVCRRCGKILGGIFPIYKIGTALDINGNETHREIEKYELKS